MVATLLLINLVCQIKYLFKVWEKHNDSLIFSSPNKESLDMEALTSTSLSFPGFYVNRDIKYEKHSVPPQTTSNCDFLQYVMKETEQP